MQVCTLLQTDKHASTPPLSFLQSGGVLACQSETASGSVIISGVLACQSESEIIFKNSICAWQSYKNNTVAVMKNSQ